MNTEAETAGRLKRLAEDLVAAARRAGADQADALAMRGHSVGIDVRGGALEHADSAEGTDIGLRVLVGGRQACVSASEYSPDTILRMAERAVAMAREAPVDDSLGLADASDLIDAATLPDLHICDDRPDPTPAHLQDLALRAEAAALSRPGIAQVEAATAGFMRRHLWIAASNGLSAGYGRTTNAISAVAITGEGLAMERDYAGESRAFADDLPDPEQIGLLAADRTLARAGAKKPPTGAFPILYDQRVAASLIGHLLSAVNGSAIASGASWLRKALGETVLPAGMDLIEDPLRPRYPSSRAFDVEGLATRRRNIITDGVLQGWTLDLATGRKLGMDSTASAARGMATAPSPTSSNVILTPGAYSQDQLIAQMGRGLVVTSMLGASVNGSTGDYSRGAAGFWVENGQIAWPVNECTIAGNLREMLMTLIAANDALPWRGSEVPSLLVEGMTVAGA